MTTNQELPQEWYSEQAAATLLGYTQVSWDNLSGEEKQPDSMDMDWEELSERERTALDVLGYTRKKWEDEEEPASMTKGWANLTSSGDTHPLPSICPLSHLYTREMLLCFPFPLHLFLLLH